jgi:hypothetical protein
MIGRPRAALQVGMLGGLVVVFMLALGAASIVVPPLLDRLVPLATGIAGASPTPSPTPSPSLGLVMNGVTIAEDSNCAGCHRAENGGMRIDVIPTLAHPLAGWTKCTECHAAGRLVPVAPGHEGLATAVCLACHRELGQGDAPTRPHHVYEGQACTTCHDGTKAPLPEEMTGRNACWLCHHDAPGASPFPSPTPEP